MAVLATDRQLRGLSLRGLVPDGCRWQVPARRANGASGRLEIALIRDFTSRDALSKLTARRFAQSIIADLPAVRGRASMNDARRKEVQRAAALIREALGILETALAGEEEDFENMPEDMQEEGQTAEDAVDCLERAALACNDAISACDEATQNA